MADEAKPADKPKAADTPKAAPQPAPKPSEALKPAPKPVHLVQPYAYYDDAGKLHSWHAGEYVSNADVIADLTKRGAPVKAAE